MRLQSVTVMGVSFSVYGIEIARILRPFTCISGYEEVTKRRRCTVITKPLKDCQEFCAFQKG